MNTGLRRDSASGAAAGLVAGLVPAIFLGLHGPGSMPVGPAGGNWAASLAAQLLLAALLGAGFGALFRYQPYSLAAGVGNGLLYGLLWWIAGPLTLAPLLHGRIPAWSLDASVSAFPGLIAYLFYGGVLGALFQTLEGAYARRHADGPHGSSAPSTHVVILGGGFGGVSAAQRLEHLLARDPTVRITLVSHSNYLLFTPMLAEVAASGLEPQHISAPVRAALTRTEFRRADVEAVDPATQLVHLRSSESARRDTIRYDQLILALGSVPSFHGIPGLDTWAFTLKSLDDATRLRNHVIGLLERADVETDPAERARQLTFVVAGGGFAGAEMVAELHDLVRGVRRFYRHIQPTEPRFVLVHSGGHILPELSSVLAEYAQRKLETRGIELLLNARVAAARHDAVALADGREVATRTIVWTAGNQPHPLLRTLPAERTRAGAVIAEPTLRVRGLPNVWAVGDCAQIPDAYHEGSASPPTAQHALRQGAVAADNVMATMRGRPPRPFRFRTIATLVALGHHTAVADVRGSTFSGLLAWVMWRTVYLSKLPGFEKKMRVALDWTLDFFFPRDIALTTTLEAPTLPQIADLVQPGDAGGNPMKPGAVERSNT